MSSLIRRIERVFKPSLPHRIDKNGVEDRNPPRKNGFMGRGEKLGVHNPKAKDLIARLKREARRKGN